MRALAMPILDAVRQAARWPAMRWLLPVLGVMALLGLLAAFQQVVRGAVAQGELRRDATLQHDTAAWHCNLKPDRRAAASCLQRLDAPDLLIPGRPADGMPFHAPH